MRNGSKDNRQSGVRRPTRASIVMSIIIGGGSIVLGYVLVLWGIGLSGYRGGAPPVLVWQAISSLMFLPANQILSSKYIEELWLTSGGYFLFLTINAILWSILVLLLHLTYEYLKLRIIKINWERLSTYCQGYFIL